MLLEPVTVVAAFRLLSKAFVFLAHPIVVYCKLLAGDLCCNLLVSSLAAIQFRCAASHVLHANALLQHPTHQAPLGL